MGYVNSQEDSFLYIRVLMCSQVGKNPNVTESSAERKKHKDMMHTVHLMALERERERDAHRTPVQEAVG